MRVRKTGDNSNNNYYSWQWTRVQFWPSHLGGFLFANVGSLLIVHRFPTSHPWRFIHSVRGLLTSHVHRYSSNQHKMYCSWQQRTLLQHMTFWPLRNWAQLSVHLGPVDAPRIRTLSIDVSTTVIGTVRSLCVGIKSLQSALYMIVPSQKIDGFIHRTLFNTTGISTVGQLT